MNNCPITFLGQFYGIEFCEVMMQNINIQPNFVAKIMLSDDDSHSLTKV